MSRMHLRGRQRFFVLCLVECLEDERREGDRRVGRRGQRERERMMRTQVSGLNRQAGKKKDPKHGLL